MVRMVRKPRKVNAELEKKWRAILARFYASGLSERPFCQREGISHNTFQYWKREIRIRDGEQQKNKLQPGNEWQRKIAEWKLIIEQARQHPKGVRDFCKNNGLVPQTLYEWYRRIKKDDPSWDPPNPIKGTETESQMFVPVSVLGAEKKSQTHSKRPSKTAAKPKFLKKEDKKAEPSVEQSLVKPSPALSGIELKLPSGSTLVFPSNLNTAQLVQVVRALEGASEC